MVDKPIAGDFDDLLDGPRRLIGLWETNRGCPFGCSFCYWGSAVNQKVRDFGMARLERELQWFSEHAIDYVLYDTAGTPLPLQQMVRERLVRRWPIPIGGGRRTFLHRIRTSWSTQSSSSPPE